MKKIIVLIIVVAIGAASLIGIEYFGDYQKELPQTFVEEAVADDGVFTVSFSKTKSFYDEDIEVELKANREDATIYYTTDGNDPTEKSKKYTSPIKISSRSKINATTIKAMAVTDSEKTGIIHKSYVVGDNVTERF